MTSVLKVDTLQNLNSSTIITQTNATTLTLGYSGQTISIPAGATLTNNGTASGFGLTWQSVQTTGFTAVKGNAYPCDTTSAGFTVTLPATPSAGDQVQLVDYAGTADTNAIIIDPNGNKIEGDIFSLKLAGEREGIILTYIDSTQGWIATSGINEGTDALEPILYSASMLIVAGGGGGGARYYSAGGGAGGFRTSTQNLTKGAVYTITVGAFGAGGSGTGAQGTPGSNSSISGSGITTITSAGGGGGGSFLTPGASGLSGGSGGGNSGYNTGAGAAGNTPNVSPSQGNNGGAGGNLGGGGGGGAGAVGSNGSGDNGGNGGNGSASSITGSSITYAGGGGGGGGRAIGTRGTGGTGGGGNGDSTSPNLRGSDGGTNLGGGGGGTDGNTPSPIPGYNGGSGVVILSVPTASYSSTTTGSPTVTTSGSNTIIKFTGSGSYTA